MNRILANITRVGTVYGLRSTELQYKSIKLSEQHKMNVSFHQEMHFASLHKFIRLVSFRWAGGRWREVLCTKQMKMKMDYTNTHSKIQFSYKICITIRTQQTKVLNNPFRQNFRLWVRVGCLLQNMLREFYLIVAKHKLTFDIGE